MTSPRNRVTSSAGIPVRSQIATATPKPQPVQEFAGAVYVKYLETSRIAVRGTDSGRQYEFSGSRPVQKVDPRDLDALLRSRFFARMK